MAAPDFQETTVVIAINGREYTEGNPEAEEVCELYRRNLLEILGNTGVQIDPQQLLIQATFAGEAHYLPNVDSSEHGLDGEGDTLQLIVGGQTHHLSCYRYGLKSVKINGEERWVA